MWAVLPAFYCYMFARTEVSDSDWQFNNSNLIQKYHSVSLYCEGKSNMFNTLLWALFRRRPFWMSTRVACYLGRKLGCKFLRYNGSKQKIRLIGKKTSSLQRSKKREKWGFNHVSKWTGNILSISAIYSGKVFHCNYRGILIYIAQTFHLKLNFRKHSESELQSNIIKKRVYPSSSVCAEKADDPHLEKEMDSYDFGCFGLVVRRLVFRVGWTMSFRWDPCEPWSRIVRLGLGYTHIFVS